MPLNLHIGKRRYRVRRHRDQLPIPLDPDLQTLVIGQPAHIVQEIYRLQEKRNRSRPQIGSVFEDEPPPGSKEAPMGTKNVDRYEIRTRADGTPELHLWLRATTDAQPDRPRRMIAHDGHRGHDGNVGLSGETNPARGLPGGGPNDPPLRRENDQEAPEVGGLPVARMNQSSVPELFVDARTLRLRGVDATGRRFDAAIFGPDAQDQPWARARTTVGDSRTGLAIGYCDDLPRSLAAYQRMLDAHYRTAR
jgi:hypothetical protein